MKREAHTPSWLMVAVRNQFRILEKNVRNGAGAAVKPEDWENEDDGNFNKFRFKFKHSDTQ